MGYAIFKPLREYVILLLCEKPLSIDFGNEGQQGKIAISYSKPL
jgi:hypothetical protein